MAQLPYTPFPEVEPRSGEISGGSLGGFGLAARGLGEVGTSLIRAGAQQQQLQLAVQGQLNDLFTNDAATAAMKRFSEAYGEFSRLEGKAANEGLGPFQKTLDQIYTDALGEMPNLDTRLQLSRNLRSTMSMYYRYGESYASTQFKQWQDNSYGNAAAEHGNQAALALNNPEIMKAELAQSDEEVATLLTIRGYDDEYITNAIKTNRGANVGNIINTLLNDGQVREAQTLFDEFQGQIDAKSRVTISNALKGPTRQLEASDIADRAVGYNQPDLDTTASILNLIADAEGTDKGRGYNETLSYGAFTGGDQNLVGMTLDQIDALQIQMLRHPDNNYNSSAVGRYQIVRQTLRELRKELGLTGAELYDEAMQDRLAVVLVQQRGNDPAGLKDEWEGLRGVNDATLKDVFSGVRGYDPASGEVGGLRNKADAFAEAMAATEDDPALRSAALSQIEQYYRVEDARWQDQQRQMQLFEKARKEADTAAEDMYVSDILNPGPQGPKYSAVEYAEDPRLLPETKTRLAKFAAAWFADEEAIAKVSAGTASELFRRIALPDGDPDRLRSMEDIDQAFVGQRLNKADYKFLREEFTNSRTPEGQAGSAAKSSLLAMAKSVIGQMNNFGITSPEGALKFWEFEQELMRREAEYRQAGKDPFQLYKEMGSIETLERFSVPLTDRAASLVRRMTEAEPILEPEVPPEPSAVVEELSPGSMTVAPLSNVFPGLQGLVNVFRNSLREQGIDGPTADRLTREYQDNMETQLDRANPVVLRNPGETFEAWDRRRRLGNSTPDDLGTKLDMLEQSLE